jgi:ABC-type branched-subunit amino acid transport system ATPase component
MSESEIDGLRERLLALKVRGTALVLVEHHIALVEAVCDEVTVLNLGTFACTGPPTEVLEQEEVIQVFLGTTARKS